MSERELERVSDCVSEKRKCDDEREGVMEREREGGNGQIE